MLLDVTRELKTLYGIVIQDISKDDKGVETKKPLTVRSVLAAVLVTNVQGEKQSAAEQVERFMLASQMVRDDKIELSSEQVTNIKKWTASRYAPLITGQICMILEEKLDATDEVQSKE